jgi:thymidine phosphorylase
MDAIDVIRTKRDGGELSEQQIRWFISAYTNEDIAPEQASALLDRRHVVVRRTTRSIEPAHTDRGQALDRRCG